MTQLPVISNYLMRSSFYPLIKFITSLKHLLSIKQLHTVSLSLQTVRLTMTVKTFLDRLP